MDEVVDAVHVLMLMFLSNKFCVQLSLQIVSKSVRLCRGVCVTFSRGSVVAPTSSLKPSLRRTPS